MKVNVMYLGRAKKETGVSNEAYCLDREHTVQEFILHKICVRHQNLAEYILDGSRAILDIVAIFVGDTKVESNCDVLLKDADEITIMPPIAGG